MSAKIDHTSPTYALAQRFLAAFGILRGYMFHQSVMVNHAALSSNQYKVLHLVFHEPGISQTVVAERLGVTTAAVSTFVREMEAQGWIERQANPEDARSMCLFLAPKGKQLFEEMFDRFLDTLVDLLDALPLEAQQCMVEKLEEILAAKNLSTENSNLHYVDRLTKRMMQHPESEAGQCGEAFEPYAARYQKAE